MSRLVDADKLIEKLKEHSRSLNCEFNSACRIIIEVVKEQPTAFNVDKVVEQLEVYKDNLTYYQDTYTAREINVCNKAIRIVKAGGIDE